LRLEKLVGRDPVRPGCEKTSAKLIINYLSVTWWTAFTWLKAEVQLLVFVNMIMNL
jgi:hypothetical protein